MKVINSKSLRLRKIIDKKLLECPAVKVEERQVFPNGAAMYTWSTLSGSTKKPIVYAVIWVSKKGIAVSCDSIHVEASDYTEKLDETLYYFKSLVDARQNP